MLGKITVQVILEKSVSQQNVYTDVLQQNLIWRLKLIEIVFKDSVYTAQKTQCLSLERPIGWCYIGTPCTVYCMNHLKYVHYMGNMQDFVFWSPALHMVTSRLCRVNWNV